MLRTTQQLEGQGHTWRSVENLWLSSYILQILWSITRLFVVNVYRDQVCHIQHLKGYIIPFHILYPPPLTNNYTFLSSSDMQSMIQFLLFISLHLYFFTKLPVNIFLKLQSGSDISALRHAECISSYCFLLFFLTK